MILPPLSELHQPEDVYLQPQLTRYHHAYRSPRNSERFNLESEQLRYDIMGISKQTDDLAANVTSTFTDIHDGSFNQVKLFDDFTGTNGAQWDSNKWEIVGGSSPADTTIEGNQGKILTAGVSLRRVKASTASDSEISLRVTWTAPASYSYFKLSLRSDATNNDQYYLDFQPQVQLIGVGRGGSATQLFGTTTVDFTTSPSWNVRFKVIGRILSYKFWPVGGDEPGWINYNDTTSAPALVAGDNWVSGVSSPGYILIDDYSLSMAYSGSLGSLSSSLDNISNRLTALEKGL